MYLFIVEDQTLLYRIELHSDSNKPELIFMEQIEDVNTEFQQVTCKSIDNGMKLHLCLFGQRILTILTKGIKELKKE